MQANPERTVATLRSVTDGDRVLVSPPPDLFDAIAAEAFRDDGESGGEGEDPAGPSPHDANVVDLAERRERRSRTITIVGAVAAGMLLLAGVAGVLTRNDDRTEVVASADLELLAGGGNGTADLVERDDSLFLVLDVSDLEPAQEADFYELWLLAPDVSDMAPLAKFESGSGTIEVELPEGVDPGEFPVVDISEELDDGDDTHSGLSILRGTLA